MSGNRGGVVAEVCILNIIKHYCNKHYSKFKIQINVLNILSVLQIILMMHFSLQESRLLHVTVVLTSTLIIFFIRRMVMVVVIGHG